MSKRNQRSESIRSQNSAAARELILTFNVHERSGESKISANVISTALRVKTTAKATFPHAAVAVDKDTDVNMI